MITVEQAYEMGAKGAEPTEAERLLFEAWMRGHCWALSATWDGKSYRSDAEQNGMLDGHAMATRRLWASWRDRAALAQAAQPAHAHAIDTSPEGWQLVPVEPTEEMCDAGAAYMNAPVGMIAKNAVGFYCAMLSAAPSTKEQSNG